MKTLSGILSFIIIAFAVAFALANRHEATISLWPLDIELHAPLFILTLGTLFFGMLAGAAIVWFSMMPHRMQARQMGKDLAALQAKVTTLQQTVIPPSSRADDDTNLLEGPKPKRRFWGTQP